MDVRKGCCTCYVNSGWGAQWKWVVNTVDEMHFWIKKSAWEAHCLSE